MKTEMFCNWMEPVEQETKKDQVDPCRSIRLVLSLEKPDLLGTLVEASKQKQATLIKRV